MPRSRIDKVIRIETTVPTEAHATTLSQILVESHHAACVHTSRVRSTYRWSSEICHEDEYLLTITTCASHRDAALKLMKKHHPYDCPVIQTVEIGHINAEAHSWVEKSVA